MALTRLYSWNVNGLRAQAGKGFSDWLQATQPDILGLQEIKCQPEQLEETLRQPEGYHTYWAAAERKGYSGVALFTRQEPLAVQAGLGVADFDREGRAIIAEYPSFFYINVYVPNGGRDLSRVPFKMAFNESLLATCDRLRKRGKPVIFCGDINTAHQEIDLARPRQNRRHTGFLPEERAWIDKVVARGYADTFRTCYPEQSGAYTWWSYIGKARARNIGWRLDYFFVSAGIVPAVVDAAIHAEVRGSDHCPVSLVLDLEA